MDREFILQKLAENNSLIIHTELRIQSSLAVGNGIKSKKNQQRLRSIRKREEVCDKLRNMLSE